MAKETKSIKYYSVRSWEGQASKFRHLSAERVSDLIDRSLTLYKQTWRTFPDILEIEHKVTSKN